MKLLLTKKELVQLGELAIKVHHISGAVMQEMGQEIDHITLSMTDKEFLQNEARESIEEIRAIGGDVKVDSEGSYVVELPEELVASMVKASTDVTSASSKFIIKAVRFTNKYKNVFIKLFNYIRSVASTFAPIFEACEVKDIQKDFDDLEEEFRRFQAKATEKTSNLGAVTRSSAEEESINEIATVFNSLIKEMAYEYRRSFTHAYVLIDFEKRCKEFYEMCERHAQVHSFKYTQFLQDLVNESNSQLNKLKGKVLGWK